MIYTALRPLALGSVNHVETLHVYYLLLSVIETWTTRIHCALISSSLVPRPSSLVGKNKGEEGLVKLIT